MKTGTVEWSSEPLMAFLIPGNSYFTGRNKVKLGFQNQILELIAEMIGRQGI